MNSAFPGWLLIPAVAVKTNRNASHGGTQTLNRTGNFRFMAISDAHQNTLIVSTVLLSRV